jgi:hypothetical protein
MTRQNTANNVFVDINAVCKCDLLGDFRTTPTRIALLHRDDWAHVRGID